MKRLACPSCDAAALRAGAVKCPVCRAWVGSKPHVPLGPMGVALVVAGLSGSGVAIGAAAVILAPVLPSGRPSAVASSASAASAGAASTALPAASGSAAAAPPVAPVAFAEPRSIRTASAPLDALVSDDDASVIVLGDDGAVRIYEIASGRELRRVVVPTRGTELRFLGGKHVAVLGGAGPLSIVDLTTFSVGRVDLGGPAIDAVALADTPSFVAASGPAGRLVRFSAEGFRTEGQAVLPRPIAGLVTARARGGGEMLAVLTQGTPGAELGTVDLLDPTAVPFGASRSSWTAAVDPRPGATGEASLLVVDRSGSQLLEVSVDRPLRIANVGQHPLSAHRLLGGWVVTVDGAGTATVVAERSFTPNTTLALGAGPSSAAVTPDGQALLIALGGGPRDRGAATALVAGDPPALVAKLSTGPGSHRVRVGKSGRVAAVTATFGRAVAILERR